MLGERRATDARHCEHVEGGEVVECRRGDCAGEETRVALLFDVGEYARRGFVVGRAERGDIDSISTRYRLYEG